MAHLCVNRRACFDEGISSIHVCFESLRQSLATEIAMMLRARFLVFAGYWIQLERSES
jgi:hypothetical protein